MHTHTQKLKTCILLWTLSWRYSWIQEHGHNSYILAESIITRCMRRRHSNAKCSLRHERSMRLSPRHPPGRPGVQLHTEYLLTCADGLTPTPLQLKANKQVDTLARAVVAPDVYCFIILTSALLKPASEAKRSCRSQTWTKRKKR